MWKITDNDLEPVAGSLSPPPRLDGRQLPQPSQHRLLIRCHLEIRNSGFHQQFLRLTRGCLLITIDFTYQHKSTGNIHPDFGALPVRERRLRTIRRFPEMKFPPFSKGG